jgi:hypothetical protein
MEALNPEYIPVDERGIGDLLQFAQEYAREVIFFDDDNNPAGNWEAFLIDDIAAYRSLSEELQAGYRKKWIAEVLSYIDNPDKFSSDTEKFRKLSRPHFILFIAFLQLLGYVKAQLNGLTKKHLDFYYFEVLRLNKKKPLPDVVNVIVELAADVSDFLIEKGTLLFAGKDSLDNDLLYTLDRDTILSQARVADIKTLFVQKKITDIPAALKDNASDLDGGFMKMMQLALGDPLPGNNLPPFKNVAVTTASLGTISTTIKAAAPNAAMDERNYVRQSLFLSEDEFNFIIDTSKATGPQDAAWERVFTLLDGAYKKKVKFVRQQALKQKREAEADKAKGFMNMYKFALGDPDPMNDLPLYKGSAVTVDVLGKVYDQLSDPNLRPEALTFVSSELLLSESDFKNSINTYRNPTASADDWMKVYVALELAQRNKRDFELASPFIERLLNVFSIDDARASAHSLDGEDGAGSKRFNTFGKGHTDRDAFLAEPANIGFAIASPQLLLSEGSRTITLTLGFTQDGPLKISEIAATLATFPIGSQPFVFLLSSEKGWLSLAADKISYGSFIVDLPIDELKGATINDAAKTITGTKLFSQADLGRYVVSTTGALYLIVSMIDANGVNVTPLGTVENKPDKITRYSAADIYFNSMQVKLSLKESDPAVTGPVVDHELISISSSYPVLGMVLSNFAQKDNVSAPFISMYQQFKDLRLDKARVQVRVENMKSLQLQNDLSVLSYKKPFEPFGFTPQSGNSLYFSHPELSGKQLENIKLQMDWMNPPADFKVYYDSYGKIAQYKNTQPVADLSSNAVFTGNLKLIDNNTVIPLGTVPLFQADARQSNIASVSVADAVAKVALTFDYRRKDSVEREGEVLDGDRYFALELGAPDFQHSIYPTLLSKQAMINADPATSTADEKTLRSLVLNPPYTPKLRALTAGYIASFEVNATAGIAEKSDSIYHINAFGYNQLSIQRDPLKKNWFLPYFSNEGEVYFGFDKLQVPRTLSILFQMAEGSGNPDIPPPNVVWSYLSNNAWYPLDESSIFSDTTNGLLNTGIIVFNLPDKMTDGDTLLNPALHWMKASVVNNAASISDTVDVFAQGVSATFQDNENADDHLLDPLPPESIKQTVDNFSAIRKINQPYTSTKGKPAEVDRLFYNRVSERLRHKNRALTMWDYERLVLEQFAEIYKVKCIPSDFSGDPADAGKVDIIVIPDIKGKLPFNPFEPKAPADTIFRIQKFLEKRIPAYASVRVKNPSYLQVKTRFAVKIRDGYNEAFYTRKLEDDLKRYLAPWAYDEGADIVLGGKIYDNVIVNFLAEKPYVEYVAGIKLFQSDDGVMFRDVRTLNRDGNYVQAGSPDVILVSALEHEIDIISEKGFEEEDFTGIGYMRIELDFIVG